MFWKLTLHLEYYLEFNAVTGMVVIAPDEHTAREIAAQHCGEEGRDVWYDPEKSTCVNLEDLPENTTMVLRDFNNG